MKRLKKAHLLPLSDDPTFVQYRRCCIEYDGTQFQGFQAQAGAQNAAIRTVQEVLEDALRRTTGEVLRVQGASRTDKGVSARGQVVVFASRCSSESRAFRDALNTRLPEDVVCHAMQEVDRAFDPRKSSVGKVYEYTIVTGAIRPVLQRRHVWYLKKPLDVARMRGGAAYLTDAPRCKDYSAFTPPKSSAMNAQSGSEKGNFCSISSVEIEVQSLGSPWSEGLSEEGISSGIDPAIPAAGRPQEEGEDATRVICVRFHGDRFLYKMVRNLVGTLVDIGLGKIEPSHMQVLLETHDRTKAGQGAPPQGLTLLQVLYNE